MGSLKAANDISTLFSAKISNTRSNNQTFYFFLFKKVSWCKKAGVRPEIAVFRNMFIQGTEYSKLQKKNFQGFPGVSAVKNPPTNAGDVNIGSISWLGRSPGGGNGNLPWYSCLGSPMDREVGHYSPMGSQRVGHNLATKQQQNSFLNVSLKPLCIRILHAQIH